MDLTREEAQLIAEEAATKALGQFFRYFDVDVNRVDDLASLRDDLEYLRDQRRGAEETKKYLKHGFLGIMILGIPGLLYWVWSIFRDGLLLHLK